MAYRFGQTLGGKPSFGGGATGTSPLYGLLGGTPKPAAAASAPAPVPAPAPIFTPAPAPAPAPSAPARNTTADRKTLTNFYKEYLGRDPDEGGLAYYQTLLGSGTPMDTVRLQIKDTEEGRAYSTNALQAVAQKSIGRPLEPAGLASFVNAIAAGASLGDAAIAIATSPEAKIYEQNRQEQIDANNLKLTLDSNESIQNKISDDLDKTLNFQYAQLAQNLQMFKQQQEQARLDAERQARQMQIAAAYGQKDPADVRFSQSAAEKKKLLTAGTSGTFGRDNLRIKGVNIKPSTGNSMASMASSFA